MPKYLITFEQRKGKVIRASSLLIAEQQANDLVKGKWYVTEVKEQPK